MEIFATYLQNPFIVLALVIWDAVWKGLALWKSARKSQKYWFIALLVINSVGIIPIIYLILNKASTAKKTNPEVTL
jgi:hypothetical protein